MTQPKEYYANKESYRISMKVKKVKTKEFNENATKSKNANS